MQFHARRLLATVAFLSLTVAAAGQTAVPKWQHLVRPPATGDFSPGVLAARELADGTVMVVTDRLIAYRYDHDGNPVSAVLLRATTHGPAQRTPRSGPSAPEGAEPGYGKSFAAIDAFGVVAVARVGDLRFGFPTFRGDIVTHKFDGLTGRSLWGDAAVYDTGTNRPDYPTGVFLDRTGDVLVTGISSSGGGLEHVTLKYRGLDGALAWGPQRIDFVHETGTAALTASGDLWVSVPKDGNFFTLLYSGSTGAVSLGPLIGIGPTLQVPRASVIDTNGAFVVVGDSDGKPAAAKYATSLPSGTVWGPIEYELPGGATQASLRDVAADADGNLLVAGFAEGPSQAFSHTTSKLSGGNGNVIWGPVLTSGAALNPSPRIAAAGNGDAVVSGLTQTGNELQVEFRRYRGASGLLAWGPTTLGVTLDDPSAAFPLVAWLIASNGRVFGAQRILTGNTVSSNVFELDGATGQPAWGPTPIATLPTQGGTLADVAGGADGSLAVVGDDTAGAMVTYKYARGNGALIWGPAVLPSASGWQAQVDASGNVIVLTGGVAPAGGVSVIKYAAADGSVLWGPIPLDGSNPKRLALDAAGDVVALFWTRQPDDTSYNVGVAKLSGTTGAALWGPVVYDSAPGQDDFARALALSPSGDVFVVGDTWEVSVPIRWFALKYSGVDGTLLWGPTPPVDGQPFAAASDPAGDLVVTGSGNGVTTVKYSGANGAVLWGPLPVPGQSFGEGRAIGVNGSGDVFVLGTIDQNLATMRYRGTDGATVWGPVLFDGEAGSFDIAYDLGLGFDGSENVVVGGYSRRLSRNYDLVTFKYVAATGATLWGPVYVGSPEEERMTGFSVLGDSVVVGSSSQGALLIAGLDESFGIQTLPPDPSPAACNEPYSFDFSAANGTTPYVWSLASGQLPQGLLLSSTGILSGLPVEQGTFAFSVTAEDAASAEVTRDFELVVGDGPRSRRIQTVANLCAVTLSLPGPWESYLWLPGGETTPTIDVSPTETTTYGVIVADPSGCLEHHSVTIPGTNLQNPACLAPALTGLSPVSGPASGTFVTIDGTNFQTGAQVFVGGAAATGVAVVNPTQITATTPALTPGTLNDVLVVNPDSGNAALLKAFFADFLDVPAVDPFHDFVVTLIRNGITAGCGGGNYCPSDPVTRAQMAVFLLKSKYGASHVPPVPTGIFNDVPAGDPFAPWIEELAGLGVTAGCGGGNYCPASPVTRAQMAVFLLKTSNGSAYIPPPAVGAFADVPVDDPFAPWIERIYVLGITGGCNPAPLLYCPASSVTRGQMAVFLVKTFNLQ